MVIIETGAHIRGGEFAGLQPQKTAENPITKI